MLQLSPQSRIFVATAPVDFRKGIDGLAAVCRQVLGDNPLEGAVYVFRNRTGTAKLSHDGPPGAVLAEGVIANFSTNPAYVQPVKFQAVRDGR